MNSVRSFLIKASLARTAFLISAIVEPVGSVNVSDNESADSHSFRWIWPRLNSWTSFKNVHIGASLFEMLNDLSKSEQLPNKLMNVSASLHDSKPSGPD